jgi:hypothetical protein
MGCSASTPHTTTIPTLKVVEQPNKTTSNTNIKSKSSQSTKSYENFTVPKSPSLKENDSSVHQEEVISDEEDEEESEYSMYEQRSFYEDDDEDMGYIRKATLFSMCNEEEDEIDFGDGPNLGTDLDQVTESDCRNARDSSSVKKGDNGSQITADQTPEQFAPAKTLKGWENVKSFMSLSKALKMRAKVLRKVSQSKKGVKLNFLAGKTIDEVPGSHTPSTQPGLTPNN